MRTFLLPAINLIHLFSEYPMNSGDYWEAKLLEYFEGQTLLIEPIAKIAALERTTDMVPKRPEEKFENQLLYHVWHNIRCQKEFEYRFLRHC